MDTEQGKWYVAYGQLTHDGPNGWRARYKRPDGTLGSRSGFSSEKEAEDWGNEQEALIRLNLWIDPRDSKMPFGDFAEECLDAVAKRLSPGTVAKYRSHLDSQLLPQWETWPIVGIFNNYIEIQKWVSELHDEYADSTIASVFATFSMLMTMAVRSRMIPANPCSGVRVTGGEYETERLVASPVHGLRAAMRLYESGLGLTGFTLCLVDLYTGARWGEIVGQQRHEYDQVNKAIRVKEPLKEVNGKVSKGGADSASADLVASAGPRRRKTARAGRTKSPAGTRWVELPPSIAVFYEALMDSHDGAFVFSTSEGHPMRRSNFRQRYWRPAWDGADGTTSRDHVPPILSTFTFNEGRHSHNTWMIEDGIPEVARRARLGQKMKGIARTYDHVTHVMKQSILDGLETRWQSSIAELRARERLQLIEWFPHLDGHDGQTRGQAVPAAIAISSPLDLEKQQKALVSVETRAV